MALSKEPEAYISKTKVEAKSDDHESDYQDGDAGKFELFRKWEEYEKSRHSYGPEAMSDVDRFDCFCALVKMIAGKE